MQGNNSFILDKHKLKVINEYKKIKRKEEKNTTDRKQSRKAFMDNKFKKQDAMTLAMSKGRKLKQEQEQRKLDKEQREINRQKKLEKRRRTHRKLTAKTPKGQPLMRNRVQFLLEKIQHNKELYCPSKT